MNWEAIVKAYPDDAEGVAQTRAIYELLAASVSAMEIPKLESSAGKEEILACVPRSLLAEICREGWVQVFAAEPELDLERAIDAFLSDDALPDLPDEYRVLLTMFIQPAVTLYMNALRQHNAELVPVATSSGSCPFCRVYPRIAFDSETTRRLSCLLCGHEWEIARIKCPCCGNGDFETLGYFEAEGIEGVRVYFCNICKHYLKVIDTRTRQAYDAGTEDIITLALDGLAEQEGYR